MVSSWIPHGPQLSPEKSEMTISSLIFFFVSVLYSSRFLFWRNLMLGHQTTRERRYYTKVRAALILLRRVYFLPRFLSRPARFLRRCHNRSPGCRQKKSCSLFFCRLFLLSLPRRRCLDLGEAGLSFPLCFGGGVVIARLYSSSYRHKFDYFILLCNRLPGYTRSLAVISQQRFDLGSRVSRQTLPFSRGYPG